jgi:outer membrane protein, multidrug efflux system
MHCSAAAVRRNQLLLVISCLLAACGTIGPDYERPSVVVPPGWQPGASAPAAAEVASPKLATPAVVVADEPPPAGSAELVNTAWWAAFEDRQLDALIRIALDENKDLLIAAYRIDQFDAQLQVTQSAGRPQVTAGVQRSRDALSQNRQVPLAIGVEPIGNSYEVLGSAVWELDLWGKLRRADQAARAELLATEESGRALVLSLVSEVASTYVRLLCLDRDLDILSRTVQSRRESLQLFRKKLEGGGVSELPVLKSRADLEEALADVSVKEGEIAILENALNGLLGRNPQAVVRGKTLEALASPQIPGGLPADLLIQRPDLRKAEQELVAANARIGVAKAQYLPTIALTGSSGFASTDLSQLAQLSSNFGSFGVSLLGPLFTSGRIAGKVREVEAIQREKATAFVQRVQIALHEVEDALVSRRKTHQRLVIRERQIAALREHRDNARKRYAGGRSSYLDVLEAERSLYAGELQENQTRRDQHLALIAVYKAMGGGWSVADHMAAKSELTTKADHE